MKKIQSVCIVDDDEIHLFLIKKLLELSNLVENILVYKDGKEAYLEFKSMVDNGEKMPELIFLDINMPIWDGWKFLENIKNLKVFEDLKIFILSSSESELDFKKAEKYNLENKYLIKPINKERVNSILHNLLN